MKGRRAQVRCARLARSWPLLLALLASCSWLVNPEKEAPRCVIDGGTDPCQQGMQCLAGRCHVRECAEREVCGDGIDNDCDGETDESIDGEVDEACNHLDDDCDGEIDEDFDVDDDGFTWCGDFSGSEQTKDCDEINPNVHPNAKEECDGIDNDCDGETDEVGADKSLCSDPQQKCIRGRCVVPSCAVEGANMDCRADENCILGECISRVCNAMTCPPGSYCDAESGTCTAPQEKAKNGSPCTTNADCFSNLCIDAAAMRMPGRSGKICGQACCDDKDCTAGDDVCFASGTGARSCLPRAEVSAAGQCSKDEVCTEPERCIIAGITETGNEARAAFSTSVCRQPDPMRTQDLGDPCLSNASCVSSLCVPDPLSILGACSVPCQVSTDCGGLYLERPGLTWTPASGPPHEYCRVVDLSLLAGGPADATDHAAVCVMGYETGDKKFGDACGANNECADGVCIMSGSGNGYCAPTCCNDAQCVAMRTGRPNARCVPMARGKHYEMRCSL